MGVGFSYLAFAPPFALFMASSLNLTWRCGKILGSQVLMCVDPLSQPVTDSRETESKMYVKKLALLNPNSRQKPSHHHDHPMLDPTPQLPIPQTQLPSPHFASQVSAYPMRTRKPGSLMKKKRKLRFPWVVTRKPSSSQAAKIPFPKPNQPAAAQFCPRFIH